VEDRKTISESLFNFEILDALLIDTCKIVILIKVTQKGMNRSQISPVLQRDASNKSASELPLNEGPSAIESPHDKVTYKIQVWEIRKEGFGQNDFKNLLTFQVNNQIIETPGFLDTWR
jgi:hypothetical protein